MEPSAEPSSKQTLRHLPLEELSVLGQPTLSKSAQQLRGGLVPEQTSLAPQVFLVLWQELL